MIFTSDQNDGTCVFVFGSNLAGRHGAGAAYQAKRNWGAVNGIGHGRQGMSYGIPTKGIRLEILPLSTIMVAVDDFKKYARNNPELKFLVTKIGCGLAGYDEKKIAPMFKDSPENCVLPEGWR